MVEAESYLIKTEKFHMRKVFNDGEAEKETFESCYCRRHDTYTLL